MQHKQLHFCGGLPRAGSTVLMNILQQNPYVFTTGTCALPNILNDVIIKSRFKESFQAMSIDDADRALYGFIKQGTHGWFDALTNKPIVISKNRSWSSYLHLFPDSKYIVMIRDIIDVAESFDRVNYNTKVLHTFDEKLGLVASMTENEKFHYYFKSPNPLSSTLTFELPKLVERSQKGMNDIIFIKYEDLLVDPYKVLKTIYDTLGLPHFDHDLNNIKQSELFEHDHAYFRERTSHVVESSLIHKKIPERKYSQMMQEKIIKEHIGFYQMFYPNKVVN